MENIWGFLNKPTDFRATYHTRQAMDADKNLKKQIWKRTFEKRKKKVELPEPIQIIIG